MEYAKSRGVNVMLPITAADLQKPVFKKFWAEGVGKRADIPEAAGVNKIDMSKFANLESFFKGQQPQEKPIEPVPAVPAPWVNSFVAERPEFMSRDPFLRSEYVFGLSSCSFKDFITRKDIALVMFYEDQDDEKSLWARAQINQAARSSKRENHGYAAVDCTQYRDLCNAEGVCNTPMYKLYSRGNKVSCIQEVCTIRSREIKKLVEAAPVLKAPRLPVPHMR